ncbi:T9SS type A sorting domain-containing protein [Marinilabilia rubra]|uniref:Glycoside hydrolase family 42 N-terminal domain-containing protein n=1 Tax=Marinilabilia rubra TaxID=2162893 RepID=A0A2U2B7M3_9BACT|nr:T9SS type A sorting domain-containing protein [Marinilabilia rubra]PWD99044.1 hypothetical protein DDZ16_12325 [Marinilabilia rubra]
MKSSIHPNYLRILIILSICCSCSLLTAQTLEDQISDKINQLELLIQEAQGQEIDVRKEKMTIRTAEIFVKYAEWDENNVATNKEYFELVPDFKNEAQRYAEELPDLIRNNTIEMLDEAISNMNLLINGEIYREPIPEIDWTQVTHESDILRYNGRPVFLADYNWKPRIPELTEFYGNQNELYFDPNRIKNEQGDIAPWFVSELENKPDGEIGFIFLGNKSVPQWAEDKYGPGFKMRENTYTGYDIDNPGAREMMEFLFEGTVPFMAGKKYSELGYMLCNEPHFYTTKNSWATGPVSEYTKEKFRTWLSNKHESINVLNELWETNFSSFDDVTIEIPIDQNLQGTPKWYDWVIFNNFRVTEWYKFLKSELQKHDPNTKVHIKIMPNLWSDNKRNHGIDFEALTQLSEISGNDAGAENSYMWGGPKDWEEHYSWDWRELCMSYDFMKSVSPDNIIYNTELHFLSKIPFRDRHMDPAYVRTTFWTAHMQGLNASQIWVWARYQDGSINAQAGKGYAGTFNQQPKIVNEIHSTMMDLNSYAEEITAVQRQRKPIRVFYSETSATNKTSHMDDVFEMYESLFFEGIPIGFATKNILNNQNHSNWDVVLVHKTQFVTESELEALQTYLNNGGTVIIDDVSLSGNEYGNSLSTLNQGTGALIKVNSIEQIKEEALNIIDQKGLFPEVEVTETNTGGHKGCVWRVVKNEAGNNVLSVVNLGKTEASLTINLKDAQVGTACKDLLKGIPVTNKPKLKPYEVYFVEITDDEEVSAIFGIDSPSDDIAIIYPNPSKGEFAIDLNSFHDKIDMSISNISGQPIFEHRFFATNRIFHNMGSSPDGSYIVNIKTKDASQSFFLIKQ